MRGIVNAVGAGVLALIFMGCQPADPEEKFWAHGAQECQSSEIRGRYTVVWKSGEIQEFRATSREELRQKLLEPHFHEIDFVEPLYRLASPSESANEIAFSTDSVDNWGANGIGAAYAWNRNFIGTGVRIAVIDTGVDLTQPQLQGRFEINEAEDPRQGGRPGVDDDHNGYIDDVYGWNFLTNSPDIIDEEGHGTHVAGIIAADHRLGRIQGVASGAKLIPIDFMNTQGGTSADAIKAVEYALQRGAQIINASWTTKECSAALETAFFRWEREPVLFVTAAGNSGANLNWFPEYPPSFSLSNQITVGSIDTLGALTSFTNFGDAVQVYAPGDFIQSLEPRSLHGQLTRFRKGTSMSAAFVSGQAAILLGIEPRLSPSDLRGIIVRTSSYGNGSNTRAAKVRVDRAVRALGR